MKKLIENYIGQNSFIFRAKLNIFYFLIVFCIVYLFGFIYFSIIDKSHYFSYIPFEFSENDNVINKRNINLNSKIRYFHSDQNELNNVSSGYFDDEFKLNKNAKFKCPIINENYAFKQIEIDGVKYPFVAVAVAVVVELFDD